jgi:hypothetical protein
MALIKKRDVKNYFAARRLQGNQIHIVPASQPDATGFSAAETVALDTIPREFKLDFVADHTEAGTPPKHAGNSSVPSQPKLASDLGRERM